MGEVLGDKDRSHDGDGLLRLEWFQMDRHMMAEIAPVESRLRPVSDQHHHRIGRDHADKLLQDLAGCFVGPVPRLKQHDHRPVVTGKREDCGEAGRHGEQKVLALQMSRQRITITLNRKEVKIERYEVLEGRVDAPDSTQRALERARRYARLADVKTVSQNFDEGQIGATGLRGGATPTLKHVDVARKTTAELQ